METIGTYADKLYISGDLWRQRIEEAEFSFIDKTFYNMRGIAVNYIVPLWGTYFPDKLLPKEIKDSLKLLKLAGGTKNRILKYLSNIYQYLIEEDIVKHNPVACIMRYSHKQLTERGIIPDEELSLLFPVSHSEMMEIWNTQRYLCAFLVLKDTGLRPGELAALKWSDWYYEGMFFSITKAIEAGTRHKLKNTKTGVHRPALVTSQTATELEALRRIEKSADTHFIFSGSKNVPYDSHQLCYALRRALRKVGIDRREYTPYWFRHTFNTNVLEDLPEEKVRILMGHRTTAMTTHYRHPNIENLKREVKKIRGL